MAYLPPTIAFRLTLTRVFAATLLLLLSGNSVLGGVEETKRVVALIDYISGDYWNAVQEGKVVNVDEYRERIEFSVRSLELFKKLEAPKETKLA